MRRRQPSSGCLALAAGLLALALGAFMAARANAEWRVDAGIEWYSYRDLGTDAGLRVPLVVEWSPSGAWRLGIDGSVGQLNKQCTGCAGVVKVEGVGYARLGRQLFAEIGYGYGDSDNGGAYHKYGSRWRAGIGYSWHLEALRGGEAAAWYTDVDDRFNDVTSLRIRILLPMAPGSSWLGSLDWSYVEFDDERRGRLAGQVYGVGVRRRWRCGRR